jgi:hypothetical protein
MDRLTAKAIWPLVERANEVSAFDDDVLPSADVGSRSLRAPFEA